MGRDQPQGALDDHVVDGHEVDLRGPVARFAAKPLVGSDQGLVEDAAKRLAEHRAGALNVGGDRRGVGDHLVLEAGVELHVTHLVDQLGRQEAALLLGVLGQHQAAELRGDPLLRDHERAEDEVEELALAVTEPGPVGGVAIQVDLVGRPVRPLPVLVEGLRIAEPRLAGRRRHQPRGRTWQTTSSCGAPDALSRRRRPKSKSASSSSSRAGSEIRT